MRRGVATTFLLVALITPTHAAGIFFVVIDKAGFCSVIEPKPSPDSGLTNIGDENGYASKEAADMALKASPEGKCKNISK